MNAHRPGTVAAARFEDAEIDFKVSRYATGWALLEDPSIMWPDDRYPANMVRPLVVLDLGAGSIPARHAVAYLREIKARFIEESSEARFFGWLADQIEEQTEPPRIPEPSMFGMVRSSHGYRYIRESEDGLYRWFNIDTRSVANERWEDIVDPILIRDGIRSAS